MPPAFLPPNEPARLAALYSYQILDTPSEDTFDHLVRLAAQLSRCPIALMTLVDEKRQWFKARHGWPLLETHRDLSFGAHAILNPSGPMVVPDATRDVRFADNLLVTGPPSIRFYAGMPLLNSEGFAVGTVCVMDTVPREIAPGDIETVSLLGEAVMAMLNLRRSNQQMQMFKAAAHDRFADVVEALPTALLLSGNGGQIRLINRAGERMFGYERSELQGRPLELLLPERFRNGHAELCRGFLSNMSTRIMGEGRALFGLRKDGSEFPLEIGLSPIEFDGESMALTVVVDIGPRRAIEETLLQKRELERSNSDLQEFAYAASHDLKAPLRAIGNLAEWIREDIDPSAAPDTVENMRMLQGRVVRLQMLLDGLLAYSRPGRTDAAAEDVNIVEVVRDVVEMMELPPGFVVDCEGPMPIIRTHLTPIQMVFKNLISNGVQHHDRSAGLITISMRLLEGKAEFRVTDDGPGIAKQFQQRIFVIFQTLMSRDEKESTGIGLAIVKKKVESNGGQIWVESQPPARGTSFVFTWGITP